MPFELSLPRLRWTYRVVFAENASDGERTVKDTLLLLAAVRHWICFLVSIWKGAGRW